MGEHCQGEALVRVRKSFKNGHLRATSRPGLLTAADFCSIRKQTTLPLRDAPSRPRRPGSNQVRHDSNP